MQRRLEELRRFSNLESEREGKSVKGESWLEWVARIGQRERREREEEEEEEEEENDAGKFLIRVSHLRPALCRYCKPSLGNDTRRYFIHKIRARTAYTPGFYYYLIADSFPIHAERDEYSFLRLCGFPFFFSWIRQHFV